MNVSSARLLATTRAAFADVLWDHCDLLEGSEAGNL